MGRRLAAVALGLAFVAGAMWVWYYRSVHVAPLLSNSRIISSRANWLTRFDSQNPRIAEEAEHELGRMGAAALPDIQHALRDPAAPPASKKAALRACAIIGPAALPALQDIAAYLPRAEYAAEAAVALSLIGREAYTPLSDGLTSPDGSVRKEALRAIGKLHFRAGLDASAVVPQLLDALADEDPGVRAIAATYLGMIHQLPESSVPALAEMLKDEDAEVRTAAATALGSFGADAQPAVPALKKATGDRDENVAREAGLALVKLQGR